MNPARSPAGAGAERRRVRDLLAALGVRPSRARGQNFLIDAAAGSRIAAAAGAGPGDLVLEVGPGLGALTGSLLAAGARVLAVEIEPALAGYVARTHAGERRLRVLAADVLDGRGGLSGAVVDALESSKPDPPGRLLVAANLPYAVASPFILAALDATEAARIVVMVQREVADRMRAAPGTAAYGPLSVLVQDAANVDVLARLGPRSFYPAPEVDSTVVALVPRRPPDAAGRHALRTAVHAAFGTRRKTLRNALEGAGFTGAAALLVAAGIDPGRRAETLSPEEFRSMALALAAGHPTRG